MRSKPCGKLALDPESYSILSGELSFGAVIQCLIPSKFTILALAAPSVFGLAQQTFWRWFPGMAVRQLR
jgi:hypothetical protein